MVNHLEGVLWHVGGIYWHHWKENWVLDQKVYVKNPRIESFQTNKTLMVKIIVMDITDPFIVVDYVATNNY